MKKMKSIAKQMREKDPLGFRDKLFAVYRDIECLYKTDRDNSHKLIEDDLRGINFPEVKLFKTEIPSGWDRFRNGPGDIGSLVIYEVYQGTMPAAVIDFNSKIIDHAVDYAWKSYFEAHHDDKFFSIVRRGIKKRRDAPYKHNLARELLGASKMVVYRSASTELKAAILCHVERQAADRIFYDSFFSFGPVTTIVKRKLMR